MQRREDGLDRSAEQAMIRCLKREGARERSISNQLLCDRIMEAVDRMQKSLPAAESPRAPLRRPLRAWTALGAAAVAALLFIGLGLWGSAGPRNESATIQAGQGEGKVGPELLLHVTVARDAVAQDKPAVQAADYLTSTTAVAVESWSTLQQSVNPLDEWDHDARLAEQMALSTLPLSTIAAD